MTDKQEIIETQPKWYNDLIFDLKKLAFEGIVKTKHSIGKRILNDELKFEKPEYGSKRIANLAIDLNVDTRDIYRCIQFARKYPKIPESVTRDKIPWRTIVNEMLPEKKQDAFLEYHEFIETFIEASRKIIPKIEDACEMKKLFDLNLSVARDAAELVLIAEAKLGEILAGGDR